MSVWERVSDGLAQLGVDRVFGIPGTQTVALFEALRDRGIPITLPVHELAGSFMANGYARANGRAGVLVTIGGPGFTYALPGLAEAKLDSTPLLHIVSAPATAPGRRFQLQAIDQSAIAADVVKGDFRLGPDDDAQQVLEGAWTLAHMGEPGPVLVQVTTHATEAPPRDWIEPSIDQSSEEILVRLDAWYSEATRPVFLIGQGARSAASSLRRIVQARRIPVVTTPSGRGILTEDHPMAMGFDVLRGGTDAVNELFESSDLVLAIGAKLGHNGSAGFELRLPADRLVHVDREPSVLGANYPVSLGIVADGVDVSERLEGSSAALRPTAWSEHELAGFRTRVRNSARPPEPVIRGQQTMRPSEFFAWLRGILPDDAILVTDSGLHQILARRHYVVRSPIGLMLPSDFQSMGFGLPGAIGARLGAPDRPVVALTGDGGFHMTAMELLTAVRDQIPLLVILFNDGQLNQIRLQQLENHGRSHAVRLGKLDYSALAAGVGARHALFGFHDVEQIRAAMGSAPPLLLEVPVGDSWGIRQMGAARRMKSGIRNTLGPGLTRWLQERLHR